MSRKTINTHIVLGKLKEVPELTKNNFGYFANIILITEMPIYKEGENKIINEWHRVVLSNEHAIKINEIGYPGMLIKVIGPQRTRRYVNKNGKNIYIMELKAHTMELVDSENKDLFD